MSRNTRKTETVESPSVGVAVGVSVADVEEIVAKAVTAATTVIHDEFDKLIRDMQLQMQSFEERLVAVESSASTSAPAVITSLEKETAELSASLIALQNEMRQHAAAANDAAQYLRRNNLRIKGLMVKENEDCRRVVTEFIRKNLHVQVDESDIEAAHTLPTQTKQGANSTAPPPMIIVRFYRRDLRDNVIRNRRQLRSTAVAIMEDLTSLNMGLLNRLRNNGQISKTWTWNGHVRALLKDGRKIQIRPFETVEDCLNK